MATDASFANARAGGRLQPGMQERPAGQATSHATSHSASQANRAASAAAHGRSRIVTSASDRSRDFRKARRHTFIVKFLRIACPVAALIGVSLYTISANLASRANQLQVRVGSIEISTKDLKMVNPHMEGETTNGGHFAVTAKSATQDHANMDLIRLADIDGTMRQADQSTIRLTSPTGNYASKAQLLTLKGPIAIKGSDGLVGHLKSARVKLKEQFLSSKDPVTIEMATGRIQSKRFNLNSKQKRAFFAGDVHVHLVSAEQPPKPGTPTPKAKAGAGIAGATNAGAPSGPVDVRSDHLTIFDAHKRAYFRGNANAIQGDFTLRAQQLLVRYEGNATPGGATPKAAAANSAEIAQAKPAAGQPPQGGAQLRQIEAKGGVVVTTKDGRVLKGNTALFDNAANTLKIDGDVVLVQEGSELSGSRLSADLGARVMQLIGQPRVKARLRPAETKKPGQPGKQSATEKATTAAPSAAVANLASGLIDFSANSKDPMDVTADTLDVLDAKHLAIFKGKVAVDRGTQHLRSNQLEIEYMGDALATPAAPAATPAKGKGQQAAGDANLSGQLKLVRARGSVLLTSDDQTVTGDLAEFDILTDRATVTGNVVVTQGKNVLKGDKLVVDMKTGQTFFDTGASGATGGEAANKACPAGRICAVFVPSQTRRAAGKSAPKTGETNNAAPGDATGGVSGNVSGSAPPAGTSSWSTRTNLGGYNPQR